MDYQFYPTGVHTAFKMARKFKNKITHLCDPSAGQGHLLKHLKGDFEGLPSSHFSAEVEALVAQGVNPRFAENRVRRSGVHHETKMSVVEIDFRHHASLREFGAKIIGHDFMQVESLATVSHVIMNPPFNQGAEHVLHAFDIMYAGELVAIINAESIKNPYTVARKRLVKLIEDHGSVEFMQDEFVDDVDRKTTVEVALIYLERIPSTFFNTESIFSGLSKGDSNYKPLNVEYAQALALPNNFIENTVHHFKLAVEAARLAAEATAISEKAAAGLGLSLQDMQAKGVSSEFRPEVKDISASARMHFESSYEELKSTAWAQIIRSSMVTDKLSNQARKNMEAKAADIYQLDFSIANIHGFIQGLVESMGDIYKEMICDMFDNIVGRSNDNVVFYKSYKSNERHRNVGMRIKTKRFIIPRFTLHFGGSLTHESAMFLADLDKIFFFLNGETLTANSDGLVKAFRGDVKPSTRIKTKFFDFRYYTGTQTIHFFPTDASVIERFNKYVGTIRNWIPANFNEVNDDFKEQYDNAEKYNDDYLNKWASSSANHFRDPVYSMIRTAVEDEHLRDIQNMESAISGVHALAGLNPGLALTHTREPQQQLLLVA